MIYAVPKKALYGALIASLLFWRDMSGALQSWGFEPNPYDRSVMNKTVGGKQFTIFWHVEDLKISHVNPKVVEKVLSQLTTKYVKVSALTVRLGRCTTTLVCAFITGQRASCVSLCLSTSKSSWKRRRRTWTVLPIT